VALTAAVSTFAFEGTIDMKMITEGDPSKAMDIVYRVKGSRVRSEMTMPADKKGRPGMQMAAIANWDKQEMLVLMPEQKMYMTINLNSEKIAKEMEKTQIDFKPTGRKEKIAGIETEEYVGKSDGKPMETWVTKELGRFMMNSQKPGAKPGSAPAWQKYLEQNNLFPLRTIIRKKEGGAEEFRMEASKVEKGSQPDSLFVPPADYQALPSMGGMLKGLVPGMGGR
jgi:hypothetical protein